VLNCGFVTTKLSGRTIQSECSATVLLSGLGSGNEQLTMHKRVGSMKTPVVVVARHCCGKRVVIAAGQASQ
jgi:hypothetical protein